MTRLRTFLQRAGIAYYEIPTPYLDLAELEVACEGK